MALSDFQRRENPNCEVHWAGFVSDTWTLARHGWDAAVESQDRGREDYVLLLRHRGCGWSGHAATSRNSLHRYMFDPYRQDPHDRPVFHVRSMAMDKTLLIQGPREWSRVDMSAGYRVEQKSLRDLAIFNPWLESEREEIIVQPDSVAELMDRIRKLQEPELREIRERNRRRELREQTPEMVCAQIISFDGRKAA